MAYQDTVFEREALYAEVWAEPVRTVAQRYVMSDVGLRKICIKLGVPLPPLGYWARVAAGKKPRVIPLSPNHKGATRYVRSVHIDEGADERGKRIAAYLAAHPPKSTTIVVKPTLEGCHAVVERMAKRMGVRSRDFHGLLCCVGNDVFPAALSESHKERGLRILDAVFTALLAAGATLPKRGPDDKALSLEVLGVPVGLRIEEQVQRLPRELTASEKLKQAKEPFFYIRDPWTYRATGRLTLTLLSDNSYVPFGTTSDGKTAPLETRLDGIVERLWSKLVDGKIRDEMRDEENARARAAWERREALIKIRDKELETLRKTEARADEWRRASVLRNYAAAFEESCRKATADGQVKPKDAARIAWIRNAADWLDPLTAVPWPDVDIGVADPNEDPDEEDDGEESSPTE